MTDLTPSETRALARDGQEWLDIPWHILRPVQLEPFSSRYTLRGEDRQCEI